MPNTNVSGANQGPNTSVVETTQSVLAAPNFPVDCFYATSQQITQTPIWHKIAGLAYSLFNLAATTQSLPICVLPPKTIIHGIKIIQSAAFLGGAISAYTLSVGSLSSPALLASAFNVYQAPGSTIFQLSANFYEFDDANAVLMYVQALSTGANLSVATQGQANIHALLSIAA